MGILVGLFLFILPGVLIMLAWAIQGNPTVVLMKPQKEPKAQATPSTDAHAAGSGGGRRELIEREGYVRRDVPG